MNTNIYSVLHEWILKSVVHFCRDPNWETCYSDALWQRFSSFFGPLPPVNIETISGFSFDGHQNGKPTFVKIRLVGCCREASLGIQLRPWLCPPNEGLVCPLGATGLRLRKTELPTTRPSTPPSLPIWTLFLNITLQLAHCVHLTLIYCVCLVSVLVLVLEVFP